MAAHFECKFKGRLGHDDGDLKESRVLNRVVRIVPEGLLYEPDPRHVELLAEGVALDMQHSTSRVTPGNKPQYEDVPAEEDLNDIISAIHRINKSNPKVSFSDDIEFAPAPFFIIVLIHGIDYFVDPLDPVNPYVFLEGVTNSLA